MAKRGRPAKVVESNEEKAIKLITENPAILEAVLKLTQSKIAQHQINKRVYKPDKPQVMFDDPAIGKAEGDWDKKRYPKGKFVPKERFKPVEKVLVQCNKCGRAEYVTGEIYGDEFSYTCLNCARHRQSD